MHPEHLELSNPVFLPVTDEVCASLLLPDGAAALDALTDPELAAVLVIQNLEQATEADQNAAAAEKVLAKLIGWAVDTRRATGAGLLAEAHRLFDQRKLYFGLQAIKGLNLRFLLADEVAARNYLLSDGKWDFDYKVRHHIGNNPFSQQMVTPKHRERWLSAAQDKLVRTFRANLDEDLHVQGYAGIGKSHLLVALLEHLRPERTLLLAHTDAKLDNLRKRMKGVIEKKAGRTFQQFAQSLLLGRRPQFANTPARVASKQAVAQELNIFGFRHHDGQATLDVCLQVIERYCRSREHSFSTNHLPHFTQALSRSDASVLLEYSSRLWGYLELNPAWGSQTGFDALLLLKRANLADCLVPPRYTHVLIDESQDIPAPLLQIIERGRQVLITLGDEYQQASGVVVKRKREVRQSDISFSVRSGRAVERLVNPLISRHSQKSKIPFEGARDADVAIEEYPTGFVPPEGCVVLTASRWDTMRWAIELHKSNCAFSFPDKTAQEDFKQFMGSAIAMFKPDFYSTEYSEKGSHRYFSDMPDWQAVCDANQFDESFHWVREELEKGFKVADLTLLNRMLGNPANPCVLMLAEEAGGMEFELALLTPELLTTVMFKDAYEFDQRICAVYIAISRAKRKLYVPIDVVEWVDYHQSREPKFRESHGH
ncbi:hypothetical protein ACOI7N_14585 [Pseudomonas sp. P2758]|uniref:hypothetical protein n=1 Tax=Pseudomonas sp. P2758 TaxID=3409916 RepID=UPI003B5A14AE